MFIVKHRMKTYGKLMYITIAVVFLSISSLKVAADDDDDDDDDDLSDSDYGSVVYLARHKACRKDFDCQNTQKCYDKKCVNVCHLPKKVFKLRCAYAAVCYVAKKHTPGCQCLVGYSGDPYGTGCDQVSRSGKKIARFANSRMRLPLGPNRNVKSRKQQRYML